MSVHVVADSSCCVPPDLAREAGLTIIPIHTSGEGSDRTTAGLGSLELTATYARLLERGGDAGVVAIHLSKELSATWTNAVTAAGIFEGKVRVLDTNSAGMVLGFAALRACEVAREGGSIDEVAEAATQVIDQSKLWLYVHKLDSLRKGGRLSAKRSFLTTALAIKPIFQLAHGELELAAKTRTLAKAMDKLVDMVRAEISAEAEAAQRERRAPRIVHVAVHQSEAVEAADKMTARLRAMAAAMVAEAKDLAGTADSAGAGEVDDADAADAAGMVGEAGKLSAVGTAGEAEEPGEPGQPSTVDATATAGAPDEAGEAGEAGEASEAGEAGKVNKTSATGATSATAPSEDRTSSAASADATRLAAAHYLPTVEFTTVELSPELAIHTGPGAMSIVTSIF